jgi:hypothetical protein
MRELLGEATETRELDDGYALRFAGSDGIGERILRFIEAERTCCPFFTFELHFAPAHGPIELRLRGPEGTKTLLRELLGVGPS